MIGLLWFDDDPRRDLKQKVADAAKRYAEKFGRPPTVCYVHPSMLDGLENSDNGHASPGGTSAIPLDIGDLHLRVMPRRSVLRHHLLVGEDD